MKVLVSGAKGFIAGYLIEDLLSNDYDVIGIDNNSKYGPINKSYDNHKNYIFIEGDVKNCPNLAVNGKKISGSAQTVKREIIQQHGTLLVSVNLEKMFKLLRIGNLDCNSATQIGKRKITSIQNELKHEISVKTVENALMQGFKAILKINLENDTLTNTELTIAKKLYESKYLTDNWNHKGFF